MNLFIGFFQLFSWNLHRNSIIDFFCTVYILYLAGSVGCCSAVAGWCGKEPRLEAHPSLWQRQLCRGGLHAGELCPQADTSGLHAGEVYPQADTLIQVASMQVRCILRQIQVASMQVRSILRQIQVASMQVKFILRQIQVASMQVRSNLRHRVSPNFASKQNWSETKQNFLKRNSKTDPLVSLGLLRSKTGI